MSVNMQTEILIDIHEEPLWITVGKYALFMSHGKTGIDAMALYMHYQFTASLQKTNQVWAADMYCRVGLDWGRDRFEKAKTLLIELGIITIIKNKNEKGQFGKTYIKIKRGKVELEPKDLDRLPENRQVDLPTSGKTTTNALSNNLNALSKKGNAWKKFIKPTKEEISEYLKTVDFTIDIDAFIDHYETVGWKVNRNPMKDWEAAVRTWKRNEIKFSNNKSFNGNSYYKKQNPPPKKGTRATGEELERLNAIRERQDKVAELRRQNGY